MLSFGALPSAGDKSTITVESLLAVMTSASRSTSSTTATVAVLPGVRLPVVRVLEGFSFVRVREEFDAGREKLREGVEDIFLVGERVHIDADADWCV